MPSIMRHGFSLLNHGFVYDWSGRSGVLSDGADVQIQQERPVAEQTLGGKSCQLRHAAASAGRSALGGAAAAAHAIAVLALTLFSFFFSVSLSFNIFRLFQVFFFLLVKNGVVYDKLALVILPVHGR